MCRNHCMCHSMMILVIDLRKPSTHGPSTNVSRIGEGREANC